MRVAVFVDAGYLFAQGAVAVFGAKKPRAQLKLDAQVVVNLLASSASELANGTELLRIYWYDGAGYAGPSAEQSKLALLDNVKLRLGLLNNQGEQKGVDSLIVTDMIELARNKAISDAVLVSGDEDVRMGVLIAQSYGVRVHLIGISPSRGSQSAQLRQEADTMMEWDAEVVGNFLSMQGLAVATASKVTSPEKTGKSNIVVGKEQSVPQILQNCASQLVSTLDTSTIQVAYEQSQVKSRVPPDLDKLLMQSSSKELTRPLSEEEKREIRRIFQVIIQQKVTSH